MKPTVTEQTSKKYKGRMAIAALICCVSVVLIISGKYSGIGITGFLVGLVLYFSARAGAWWNHG